MQGIKDCFDIIPELREKFLNEYKEGMSDEQQKEIGTKLALEYHNKLFEDLNDLKEKITGERPKEEYHAGDQRNIADINAMFNKKIAKLRSEAEESVRVGKMDMSKVKAVKSKPYTEINEPDSQIWQHPTSYRETLYRGGGRFTNRQEKGYQWEMAYERLAESKLGKYEYTNPKLKEADSKLLEENPFPDIEVTYPIIKPKAAGIQWVNGVAVAFIDKASWSPTFYRWIEGTQRMDLYRLMRDKGTDYVRVKSAHKVGIQSDSITDLYNDEGGINTEGMKALTHEQIPYDSFGIQVEQSGNKNGVTEGSQLHKIATADLYNNKVPIDFKGKPEDWHKMNESDKAKTSPIHNLVQYHEELLSEMANKRFNNILKRFDVSRNEDGSYSFNKKEKLSNWLIKQIRRRELPENMAYGLEIDPDTGNFKRPLESNVRYKEIQDILYSIITKDILRSKVNGAQMTMLANTMFEKEHRIHTVDINGKRVMVSNDLNSYVKGPDGTIGCEVYIPYMFGKEVRDKLVKKHGFKTDKEFKDHLLNYLNSTEEGQSLLSGIGFRIPTQGVNSVDFFRIKGFLPEQMGNVIVLPSDITAKAGSDFDIDKLSTYLKNFRVDYDGYPHPIRFENIDTNSDKELGGYWDRNLSKKYNEWKKWDDFGKSLMGNHTKDNKVNEIVNKLFNGDTNDNEEDPDFVEPREAWILDHRGANKWQLNSIEALENEYFDTLHDILSLPERYNSLVRPNDATESKDIATKIADLWGERNAEKYNYGDILNSTFMRDERHGYVQAKDGIKVSASSQTAHSVAQLAGVSILDKDVVVRVPHNTDVDGNITLSGMFAKGSDREMISSSISQFSDGFVDIAKGNWLSKMGVDQNTAKNFILMFRWGTPRWTTALFNNQPAVREFLRLQSIHNTAGAINPDIKSLSNTKVFNEVAKLFGQPFRFSKAINKKPSIYTNKDMEDAIKNHVAGKLSHKQKLQQMQILDDFINYFNYGKNKPATAWNLFNYFQGYNWDTDRMGDPNMVRRKILKYQKAAELPITPIGNLMDKSFIGSMMNNTILTNDMLKQLFPIQQGVGDAVHYAFAKDILDRKGLTKDEFKKQMTKVTLSMKDSLIQTKAVRNGKSLVQSIPDLILGKKPMAYYVDLMQKSSNPRLAKNPFLVAVRADVETREGFPSSIMLKQRDSDTYTSNELTYSLRQLKDDATIVDDKKVSDIYPDLLRSAVLQFGDNRTKKSWAHLIPNEDYADIVGEAPNSIDESLLEFYDNNSFYRNNWNDDKLVPIIPKTQTITDENGNEKKTYDMVWKKSMATQLNKGNPILIKLKSFDFKDKKAMKIVDYIRDKNNKILGRNIRLFTRVDSDGKPLELIRNKKVDEVDQRYDFNGNPIVQEESFVIFKEINKWGDGDKLQEYHTDRLQSYLKSNPIVHEYDDAAIIDALDNNGFKRTGKENEAPKVLEVSASDDVSHVDERNDDADNDDRVEQKSIGPDGESNDNLKECTTGTFSVKGKKKK